MNKQQLKEIIKEEIQEHLLQEALDKKDMAAIRQLIRTEIATVMFDLFKKRAVWL